MNATNTSAAAKLPTAPATRLSSEGRTDPLDRLRAFLDTHRMKEKMGPGAFAEFERELQARTLELQRDVIASEMKRLDIDVPAVVIDGKVHRRVLRQSQTYMTSAGEVVVERTLYKDRTDDEGRAVSPMELTLVRVSRHRERSFRGIVSAGFAAS